MRDNRFMANIIAYRKNSDIGPPGLTPGLLPAYRKSKALEFQRILDFGQIAGWNPMEFSAFFSLAGKRENFGHQTWGPIIRVPYGDSSLPRWQECLFQI